MTPEIKIFSNKEELAEAIAEHFIQYIRNLSEGKKFISIGLSGGTTPMLFFRRLASLCSISSNKPDWNKIHFFWGDERCVPPSHDDSNYGMFNRLLIRPLNLPPDNIHRIMGEADPNGEAGRYSNELRKYIPLKLGYPKFDWIILGLGEDGHTASVFPDQLSLLYSKNDCEVVQHPQTGQKRITLTGKVLINANQITFLVSGENKKEKVNDILTDKPGAKAYPAYFIKPVGGKIDWFLDKHAASLLKNK